MWKPISKMFARPNVGKALFSLSFAALTLVILAVAMGWLRWR